MFEEKNPEVNLPSNLDISVSVEDFSPLNDSHVSLKNSINRESKSGVEVAFKS